MLKEIMPAKSFFRGHEIVWVNERWLYADTRKELPGNGGETRPCVKCGKLFALGEGEHDPCLGILPGVVNACCGHGKLSEAYIRFSNGVTIKNFNIEVEKAEEAQNES